MYSIYVPYTPTFTYIYTEREREREREREHKSTCPLKEGEVEGERIEKLVR